MPENFLLKPLPSITFGAGSIASLARIASTFGSRFLVITGASFRQRSSQWHPVEKELLGAGATLFFATIASEPTPEVVDDIVTHYRPHRPDAVIAIGGGSVLDGGKAVSAMLPAGERVVHYLEGVGSRKPTGIKTPFIAVPTTAGTGSEATANAVISRAGRDGFKKSLRHDRYIPDHAVVDPELMRSCPPSLTASCAMDSFTQLVEGYLSVKSSQISDSIAWEGLKNLRGALPTACSNGDDIDARTDMAFASMCSGIVLANAGLGIIHGLAPPLGCLFDIPHGLVCGTLMASGNAANLRILSAADADSPELAHVFKKYEQLDRLFCKQPGSGDTPGLRFTGYLHDLTETLALPRLSQFGVTLDDLEDIAAGASNKNNPVLLDNAAIKKIVAERI